MECNFSSLQPLLRQMNDLTDGPKAAAVNGCAEPAEVLYNKHAAEASLVQVGLYRAIL